MFLFVFFFLINSFGGFYFEKLESFPVWMMMTMLNDEGGGGVATVTRAARRSLVFRPVSHI